MTTEQFIILILSLFVASLIYMVLHLAKQVDNLRDMIDKIIDTLLKDGKHFKVLDNAVTYQGDVIIKILNTMKIDIEESEETKNE